VRAAAFVTGLAQVADGHESGARRRQTDSPSFCDFFSLISPPPGAGGNFRARLCIGVEELVADV